MRRVAATTAHTERADAVLVDVIQRHEVVDGAPEILHPGRWVLEEPGFAAAGALVRRVECQRDVAQFREPGPVDAAGGLFLATADGVCADDGRVLLVPIEIGWEPQVGRHLDTFVGKSHRFHERAPSSRFAIFGAGGGRRRPLCRASPTMPPETRCHQGQTFPGRVRPCCRNTGQWGRTRHHLSG